MFTPQVGSHTSVPFGTSELGEVDNVERKAVHFAADTMSSSKLEDPLKDEGCSCWDGFCNAFVDGFTFFAQAIFDFFVNLFRSRDTLDGLKEKVYAAVSSNNWSAVLSETATLIKWTRDNKDALTGSQARRANAIVQDVVSRLGVIDPNISKTETVLAVIKKEIGGDEAELSVYMAKNPRSEVIMNAMNEVAQNYHLGKILQDHIVEAKKMESTLGGKTVLPYDRRQVFALSLQHLSTLINLREDVIDMNDGETTRIYQAAIIRFSKLIDRADSSKGKELSSQVLDGRDFAKDFPAITEEVVYTELQERVDEILGEVLLAARESSARVDTMVGSVHTAKAANKFLSLLKKTDTV